MTSCCLSRASKFGIASRILCSSILKRLFFLAAKVAKKKKKESKSNATFEAALPEQGQNGKEEQYVTAPHVLFPAPIHPSVAAEKGRDNLIICFLFLAISCTSNRPAL